ncbi:alcohol dehydrogenase [Lentilactobacillus buchneri]|uniref:zinc-binding dehydrogenase n=1 Tax=Lentilactobacillus buchneri TaxID=1581 RepID=UPI0021A795E7|nr:zinc-binding dehydrogenase [Lentilactobacillus buchneri]MCT3560631.1 alcohol dehydrogenase [Lentilactobacillus buchneri]
MKGWQFTETDAPLTLVEQVNPEPASNEVILAVKAAGLCHTDVGILHDPSWAPMVNAPVILGHEVAGIITKVGQNVTAYHVGDRVGVSPLNPETGQTIGTFRDGGYSDQVAVPEVQLVPLPDSVSYIQGAAATDAGMSSYHPLFVVGGAKKGMKVGIIGAGGLGQFAANMAVIAGCEVSVADTKASAREWAKSVGVQHVHAEITDMKADDLELIIDFAGFDTTTNDAIHAVKAGGTVVLVGMGILHSTIDTGDLIFRNITLVGNCGGTPEDIADVYRYFETGKLAPELTLTDFDHIPEGLMSLEKGEVSGRLIAARD